MAVVRIALERLLVLLFWSARAAFFAFALATATTLLAAGALAGPEAPAWLDVVTRSCLWIGGTFGVITICCSWLPACPHLRPTRAEIRRRGSGCSASA
jgi:sulfite exporter TauE/SafE